MGELVNTGGNGKGKEIIIPDASPLIYLSKMNLLGLLPKMYDHIVITDVVWMEATRGAEKFKDAARIIKWGEELQEKSPNCLLVAETPLGRGIKAIMKDEPNYRQRDAGEDSIIQWVRNASYETRFEELHPDILYENGKVPTLVSALEVPVTTLNTSAFLQRAIDAGHPITLEKILKEMAESQVHFKLEHSVKHNDAALDRIVGEGEGEKIKRLEASSKDIKSPWTEEDTQAYLQREKKMAEFGEQRGGSWKKDRLKAETKELKEKADFHRKQNPDLDQKLAVESRKIKRDMDRGR